MKIGERGQVTIPKELRDQFGLRPETEVEFHVVGGDIVLKKTESRKMDGPLQRHVFKTGLFLCGQIHR